MANPGPDIRTKSTPAAEPTGVRGGARPRLTRDEFGAEVEACRRSLWAIAAAIVRDTTQADDVVQEAAMTAYGKLNEFDPATSFVAWAGQITRYTALNSRRSKMRDRTSATDPTVMTGLAGGAESAALGGMDLGPMDARLEAALDQLQETARTCVIMRVVLEMSYKDVSTALGIPEGTAMSHVHRATKLLRTMLSQEGGGERETRSS